MYIEKYRHPLPCAGPCTVECEVVIELRVFLLLRLPNAERESRVVVFAVPSVTEILGGFAGPVKAVRSRKHRDGAGFELGRNRAIVVPDSDDTASGVAKL